MPHRFAYPRRAAHRAASPWLRAIAGLLLAAGAACAPAQADYPSRALRLIVPFPPGGAADAIGRLVGARLSERLGQPVSIENRPGGGTVVAAQAAATAAPDGYTLSLATTGQLAINPSLHDKLSYDPVKSFQPIGLVASVGYIIAVAADSPLKSLKDLVAQAKAKPGSLAFSSCGNATACHLAGELFKSQAGIDLLHVPFSGSVPALTAVLGGQVQIAADTVTILAPQVRAGKLRGLVLTDSRRSPVAPEVPTATEAGLPGLLANSWFGVVVPAGVPAPVLSRLARELAAVQSSPETKAQLASLGLDALSGAPEDFATRIRADLAKWSRVVKLAAVRAD
jgi:tripartite-type tricarboxylate transporter receptor subunit TctC